MVDISKYAPEEDKSDQKVKVKKISAAEQNQEDDDKEASPYILKMDPEIQKELKR